MNEREIKKPPFLMRKAYKYWDFLLNELQVTEGFRNIDTYQLGILANALNDYADSTKVLESEGKFYKTGSGLIRLHPANSVQADSLKIVKELGQGFGLNFRSRENLLSVFKAKKQPDNFDKLD